MNTPRSNIIKKVVFLSVTLLANAVMMYSLYRLIYAQDDGNTRIYLPMVTTGNVNRSTDYTLSESRFRYAPGIDDFSLYRWINDINPSVTTCRLNLSQNDLNFADGVQLVAQQTGVNPRVLIILSEIELGVISQVDFDCTKLSNYGDKLYQSAQHMMQATLLYRFGQSDESSDSPPAVLSQRADYSNDASFAIAVETAKMALVVGYSPLETYHRFYELYEKYFGNPESSPSYLEQQIQSAAAVDFKMPFLGTRSYSGGPHGGGSITPCVHINVGDASGLDFGGHDNTSDVFDTAVVAIAGGTVVGIKQTESSPGRWVAIRHENSVVSMYWHLSTINSNLYLNQQVSSGAYLGERGATGCPGCGAHIHLELRTGGQDYNTWGGIGSPVKWQARAIDGWLIYAESYPDGTAVNYNGSAIKINGAISQQVKRINTNCGDVDAVVEGGFPLTNETNTSNTLFAFTDHRSQFSSTNSGSCPAGQSSLAFASSITDLCGGASTPTPNPNPTLTSIPPSGNEGVKLCRDVNYGGYCTTFTSDTYSLGASGFGNDDADSIQIIGDWSGVLYRHETYEGERAAFDGSDPDLMDNTVRRNDASSLRVRRRNPWLVTLYEHNNYNGQPFASDREIHNLDHWNFNDQASSIRVASGYCVRLYDDANFGGNSVEICGDRTDISGFDNRISSFQICSGSCPPLPPTNTPTATATPTPTATPAATPTPRPTCAPANHPIFGDGRDCDLIVASTHYVDTTRAALTGNAAAGQNTLSVSNSTGFAANQEVLIIQSQGSGAGTYEFVTITAVGSGTLTLQQNLRSEYFAGGNNHAQVLQVPHYRNVTVQNGGNLTAQGWDGSTGGIVVFRANGQVTIVGAITVDGRTGTGCGNWPQPSGGFRWGQGGNRGNPDGAFSAEGTNGMPVQNSTSSTGNGGGGGGNGTVKGGGGGGNGQRGEDGGLGGGEGGASVGTDDLSRIVFGGGGGGGMGANACVGTDGGNGGGIIIIGARDLTVTGVLQVNGGDGGTPDNNGAQSAGGGGGAGGSILLRCATCNVGTNLVTAIGGKGGQSNAAAYGGRGGSGRIRIEYFDALSGSTNPVASVYQYPAPTPTSTPTPTSGAGTEILGAIWTMSGSNGSAGRDKSIASNTVSGATTVQVTFNLRGTFFGGGDDEASIAFVQNNDWRAVNVVQYGQNGLNGLQTVTIPITAFHKVGDPSVKLDTNLPVFNLVARFWNSGVFTVDVTSVKVLSTIGVTVTPTPTPPTPTPASGNYAFFKGINFNGNAVTIEGNTWQSFGSALGGGLSIPSGYETANTALAPNPTVGSDTNAMLNSVIWKNNATLTINQILVNGDYQVYLWVMENYRDYNRKFNVKLEGSQIATEIGSLPKNSWVKYGPYNVTVSDGTLNMDMVKVVDSPHIAGVAIYKQASATLTPVQTPTSTSTSTPVPTNTATPTPTPTVANSGLELLTQPWHLVGNNGAAEAYQSISPTALQGKNMLRITYNLNGLQALGGDASAIIFDQNGWRYISLANYGQNGKNGVQMVEIPLAHFPGLNSNANVGTLHTRFWYSGPFVVDITSIVAYSSVNAASETTLLQSNYLPVILR